MLCLAGCTSISSLSFFPSKPLEPLATYDLGVYEKQSPRSNIHIAHDPVYKKRKSYTGVSLQPLFDAAITNSRSDCTVIFRCTDGYAPVASLSALRKEEAFLAVRDNAESGDDLWELFADGKSPAPYYIVWPNVKDQKSVPWPYQVRTIELYDASAFVQGITRGRATAEHKGRDIFFRTCLSCHSLAGMGGTVGPDLVSPVKVTDYWRQSYLRRFIANPLSVRHNSKMPAPQLSDREIDDVIAFLSAI